jgi:peptidoglycan/LPS O-acetylase OafA/YrhL
MALSVRFPRPPTLAEAFSPRANSIGLLRLSLASALLVAHSWPVGFGEESLGTLKTGRQTDVGTLALYGFFVVSGFLITGSGLRFSLPRFAWHRFLRIFPGLWVCLLLTALVLAPAIAYYERGTLGGFWDNDQSPISYLINNWWTAQRQFGISHLLESTPYGQATKASSVFNGSLWSLVYELCCYILIGTLAVTGVLGRAPRAVLALTGAAYVVILADFVNHSRSYLHYTPLGRGLLGPFPFIGELNVNFLIYLTFTFLLGACAQLFKERVPMHPVLAVVAFGLFLGTLKFGGFFAFGLPAYAYLLLWLACSLPRWVRGIGRKRDYSYGIYVYAFPVQQAVALLGGNRWGIAAYIGICMLGTLLLAVPSWHLVEHPAMGLKDWTPSWLGSARRAVSTRLPTQRQPIERPSEVKSGGESSAVATVADAG